MPEKKVHVYYFNSPDYFGLTRANALISAQEKDYNIIEFPVNTPKIIIITPIKNEKEVEEIFQWLKTGFSDFKHFLLVIDQLGKKEMIKEKLTRIIISKQKQRVADLKTPLLQVALDLVSAEKAFQITSLIPKSDRILMEAGTPLIKAEGIRVIEVIKQARPFSYTVADLKTLDTGSLEVSLAASAGAEIVSISGLANVSTLNEAIKTARKLDMWIYIDMMNVDKPQELLSKLDLPPDVVLLHRGIDMEFSGEEHKWDVIKEIKEKYPGIKIAVAGGINLDTAKDALEIGADIIIVGRAITGAENIEKSVKQFLEFLNDYNG